MNEKRHINLLSCLACRKRKTKCQIIDQNHLQLGCKHCLAKGMTCEFREKGKRGPSKRSKWQTQVSQNTSSDSLHIVRDGPLIMTQPSSAAGTVRGTAACTVPSTGMSNRSSPVNPSEIQSQEIQTTANSQNKVAESADQVYPKGSDYGLLQRSGEINPLISLSTAIDAVNHDTPTSNSHTSPDIALPNSVDKVSPGALSESAAPFDTAELLAVQLHKEQIGNLLDDQYQKLFIDSLPSWLKPLSTDLLCSRIVFEALIRVYLKELYCLTPLVHRPTFVRDLNGQREREDPVFLALLLSIAAFTLANIPRKFIEFKFLDPNLRYSSYQSMFAKCHEIISHIKISPYWISTKNKSLTHYSTLTFLSLSDHYINGNHIRAAIMHREALGVLYLLRVHRWPSAYMEIDAIESELRKRAFWIEYFRMFMENILDNECQFDFHNSFGVTDLSPFLPAEVDDEFITSEEVGKQPEGYPSLMKGFCTVVQIHSAAENSSLKDEGHRVLNSSMARELKAISILKSIKELTSTIPDYLSSWDRKDLPSGSKINVPSDMERDFGWYSINTHIVRSQIEIQRSNIGVTQLWLQNMLLENISSYRSCGKDEQTVDEYYFNLKKDLVDLEFWKERVSICEYLLNVLSSVSLENIEPNGLSMILKLRMIASSLIKHTLSDQRGVLQRAQAYLTKFLDIIVQIESHRGTDMEENGWIAFNKLL